MCVCVCVCVCDSDHELQGCVGRSILCPDKLISRIQMLGVRRMPLQPFMNGKMVYSFVCDVYGRVSERERTETGNMTDNVQ